MAEPPPELKYLTAKFEQNIESYRNPSYGEAEVRVEFINPLFDLLGWDVANKAGHAEAYKDLIHEDAIKVGGSTKAPDYSFRIGGVRKFFLEAKKPSVTIKDDTSPAYQLRRYAWSAKLPLSILTNFAEFAVYDCRVAPKAVDKASVGRVLYFTYNEYESRWEEIAKVFSKEAILQGSFDKFAETGKGKRGTSPVDAQFLAEIESWREALAKNLALRNPRLSVRDLNFAVQRTIDRIIFLRMCEDRGIEHYAQLQGLLNGENTYKRLQYLYGIADEKYNSGLFHFREEKDRAETPDELTLTLKIDDKVLKDIIGRLYYPESPYEFSVLGGDILGNVYEQFLGKVIRLTAGHHAVIEEKPEVKKAGGVYYTPAYIVDYIVKNTVGKLCEGKSPRQIEKFRILDPACGSGSFLIGAYTYLLNHHRDWYVNDGPQKHTKVTYQGAGGHWYLTTQEKKRILLNNIYGVDIDSQAVEVTKLSLLLKVLEGESEETIGKTLKLFRERALPDLGNNIKCGNSLIGPDFYQNQQLSFLDEEERYHINVFDWNAEFPGITKSGGFDGVIGNPPYIAFQEGSEIVKNYYKQNYRGATGKYDQYILFIEKSILLLKSSGLFGFIVPNKFIHSNYGEGIKSLLLQYQIIEIMDFNDIQIFAHATNYPCILILRKSSSPSSFSYNSVVDIRALEILANSTPIQQSSLTSATWILVDRRERDLLEKLKDNKTQLGSISRTITQGLRTGLLEVFFNNIDAEFVNKNRIETKLIRPIFHGKNVKRYATLLDPKKDLILFPYGDDFKTPVDINKSPNAKHYLGQYKAELRERKDSGRRFKNTNKMWFEYWDSKPICFESPKIIFPDISSENNFYLDLDGIAYLNTCYGIFLQEAVDHKYILGILNSKAIGFFIRKISPFVRGGFYRYKTNYVEQIPIQGVDSLASYSKKLHHTIVSLVAAAPVVVEIRFFGIHA